MAGTNKLFTLASGNSGNLTLSGSSATVSIASLMTKSEDTIRLYSDVVCWVRLTVGAGTAVTTDVEIGAALPEAFAIPPDVTHLSAIAGGAGTLNYAVSKGA